MNLSVHRFLIFLFVPNGSKGSCVNGMQSASPQIILSSDGIRCGVKRLEVDRRVHLLDDLVVLVRLIEFMRYSYE